MAQESAHSRRIKTYMLAVLTLWLFMKARRKDTVCIYKKHVVHRTDHLAIAQANSIALGNLPMIVCGDALGPHIQG